VDDFRVLIVDDDFHVARLHTAYVESVPGFTALPAVGSGEAAIRAVKGLDPDLVLIDIYLPDINGLEILRSLDVDAFVISAASDALSVRRAMRRGALTYLIKPFPEELLTQRLREYARYRRVLGDEQNVDQEVVERALRILHPGDRNTGRPRAVTELSVMEVLKARAQPTPAAEIAAEVGISRATAQRYLSGLVDDGAITVQLRYGTTGRPEHRYSIREELVAPGDRALDP
jgi:two-component system CitB family response regulator